MWKRLKNFFDTTPREPTEWEAEVNSTDLLNADDNTLLRLYRERDPQQDKTSLANQMVIGTIQYVGLGGNLDDDASTLGTPRQPESKLRMAANTGLLAILVIIAILQWWQS